MKEILKGVNIYKLTIGMIVSIIDSITYFILPLVISIYLNDSSNLDMIKTFIYIFIAFIITRTLIRFYFYFSTYFVVIFEGDFKFIYRHNVKTIEC